MIDVKNLNKTYGEKEAAAQVLKHVSFSLEKGCFCSIVGPSGSGKSTLLNILKNKAQILSPIFKFLPAA